VLGPESSGKYHLDPLSLSQAIADQEGNLWIGTYNFGLLKFNPKKKEFKDFPTGRVANQVVSLSEGIDENGKRILWVGDEQGLGIFRPDQEKFYFFSDILPKTFAVNYIYRNEMDGVVWFCTSNGVIKYHPQSNVIQGITFPATLLSDKLSVNVIHQDQRPGYQHLFYFGLSNNFLLRWDRAENEFISIRYPAGAAETKWIRQRDDETLWIGTNRWDYLRPGIFVYDLKKEKFIDDPPTKGVNQFFSVPFFMYGVFDDQHQLIVGNSDEGLHVVEEHSGRDVTPWPADSMKNLVKNNNLINHILVDSKGKLWLGTYRGVFFYDALKKQFVCADPQKLPDSVDDSAVNTLLEDRDGNMWAARWGSLTSMSKLGKLTTVLTPNDGFVDRQIRGLAEDHNGIIWIGNYEGLYCYNPVTKRLTRFTMNDGLLSNKTIECLFMNGEKNELFVGHVNGFNLVKVDQLLKTLKPPPLVFNTFKIHEQERSIDFSKPLKLKPAEKVFSVDFVALNYRKEDDNQYAYYLEGFENDWNYSGSKHTAYYTNLNPGDYTLHVRAGDAFGNWNSEDLKMSIEVLPAFYQTVWFKILISLIIAGLLYTVYQYRINQLLHLQQVRNRISADLHDELGSTLSGISIMGSLAKKELTSQDAPSTFVDRIMEDVRQMSSSLDDIVWNISPKNDALSSLVARMTRYASELFEAKQIDFTLKVPDRLNDVKLSMDQRRNIYLIFKESVNNLVKYSKCQRASVNIEINKRNFQLVIQDDGVGFNPQAPTDRNGIRNLKERAKTLGGKLDIESYLGKGTTIKLEFPIEV
jgi:signal transduction histidine kinase/ligand-binding sensor domain-containing protein